MLLYKIYDGILKSKKISFFYNHITIIQKLKLFNFNLSKFLNYLVNLY
jgi:hypothetical protein